ncbi:mucin-19 [Rhineura floridana]|uniref:mucin-19 n=1 Tax=Rhineura floridana TaxID=261503 RepID=UPI002AC87DF2|nr:mucin-19 [Rhineura floridana]
MRIWGLEKPQHVPDRTPLYSKKDTDVHTDEASTWGKGSYKTFDNRMFTFKSYCNFTFCRHCVESGREFNVEINRNKEGKIGRLSIVLDGNDITVKGSRILINSRFVQVPFDNKMIHIKKYGDYTKLESRRGILTLLWNDNDKVSLTLHKAYDTCGLCGDSRDSKGTDITKLITDSKIPDSTCPEPIPEEGLHCEEGRMYCRSIISKYFKSCKNVGKLYNEYERICIEEYCKTGNGVDVCPTFFELAQECASGGSGPYEKWRSDPDVVCDTPACPESEIYSDCGPSNQATCTYMSPYQETGCVSGCVCPKGYVLDDISGNGRCIAKTNCACKFNGKVYRPGEERKGLCNSKCTCHDAKWTCTEPLCPGRCKVEGPFITTFDGTSFTYAGDCHLVAIQDKDWSLSVELRPCATGSAETCLKSVTLSLGQSLSADRYTFHNNGSFFNDKIKDRDYYASDQIIIFRPSSSNIEAELFNGLKLQLELVPTMQLYASLPAKKYPNTGGLCGSFNNKAEDDFMSSQNILEVTSESFASSWEMMTCPKPKHPSCTSIEKERYAKENCAVLNDPNGIFASGHSTVDHKTYYERCLISTCVCEKVKDCLCTALGNYVKACTKHGIYITGWRKGICGEDCEEGKVFQYSVKACNTSCRSFSERDLSCDVIDIPVDGCVCPEGRYLNSKGMCVEREMCDCYINNEVVVTGQNIHLDNYMCACRKGQVLCHNPSDFKPVTCTGGAEFITCSDPKAKRRVDKTCSALNMPHFSMDLPCRRGCYCPLGRVRNSDGECILPSHCPCSYSGRKYNQGSSIQVDCNTCTCTQGSWTCTENKCQSSCHIYGDGQVQTFDGKWYSYDGLCQYVLAEDYCGKEDGLFRILTESVPCCDNGVTCSRKITVILENGTLVLEDGKYMFIKDAGSTQCETDKQQYTVHTVGLYLIIKYIQGITLFWDKNTRVSIIMEPNWTRQVCGLCGNHNGNLQDELTTRQGLLAAGPVEFGNSWKTSSACSDTIDESFPCDANTYCKDWALRKCEIIRDYRFRACHSRVDPTPYHKSCIEEACACTMEGKYLGFCTAVAMYAEACSAVGICIHWRTPELCPVFCDYYNVPGECSWHYEPCGTVTAKTCKDHVIGRTLPSVLEGCYAKCPDNAPYLDENIMKCVRLSDCTCFHNDIILAGQIIYDNCGRICVCKAGELVCSDFPGIPRMGVVPSLKKTTAKTATKGVTEGRRGSTPGWNTRRTTEHVQVGKSTEAAERITTESVGNAKRYSKVPRTISGITSSARPTGRAGAKSSAKVTESITTETVRYSKPGGLPRTSRGITRFATVIGRVTEHISVGRSTEGMESVPGYTNQHTEGPHGTISGTEMVESHREPATEGYSTSLAVSASSATRPGNIGITTRSIGGVVTGYTEGVQEGLSTAPKTSIGRSGECPTVPEPTSCRFQNEYYEIGEKFKDPSNPCLKYTCTADGFKTEVEECAGQRWCNNGTRIYHENKCCYDCVNQCRPIPVKVGVSANGCKSHILMPVCSGECKKVISYSGVDRQMMNKCFCCKAKEHVYKNIPIFCPTGKLIMYKYKHTVACSCQACKGH